MRKIDLLSLPRDIDFNVKYPPRGSWIVHGTRAAGGDNDMSYVHGGYYSEKLRRCPVCRRFPVFQESAYHATPPTEKAKVFYGFCPTCELRTRKPGTLKEAVVQWQNRKFSRDSLLVCHRPRLDTYGCRLLCNQVVGEAIDDALFYARNMLEADVCSELFQSYRHELKKLEQFFRESVFMFELDADGVISEIRRAIFPMLEPKDRVKIPLHLYELYKGKEIVRECTNRKNSKKRP